MVAVSRKVPSYVHARVAELGAAGQVSPSGPAVWTAVRLVASSNSYARGIARRIIHSDHGTQFRSWAFTSRAKQSGLLPSMGSIGDCYDSAVIKSFWSRMQVELTWQEVP
jgi:transposase InsO family protein